MIETVTVGLAAARLTRAWFHDTVGEFARGWVDRWTAPNMSVADDDPTAVEYHDSHRTMVVKDAVDELASCPHCIGFWFAFGCAVLIRFRLTRPLVVGLAGAAIQSWIADMAKGDEPVG